MGIWEIKDQIETAVVSGRSLRYVTATRTIDFVGGTSWGNVTATGTAPSPAYEGREIGGDKRPFKIFKSGDIVICSLEPIFTKGGGSGVAGGTWTATDQ